LTLASSLITDGSVSELASRLNAPSMLGAPLSSPKFAEGRPTLHPKNTKALASVHPKATEPRQRSAEARPACVEGSEASGFMSSSSYGEAKSRAGNGYMRSSSSRLSRRPRESEAKEDSLPPHHFTHRAAGVAACFLAEKKPDERGRSGTAAAGVWRRCRALLPRVPTSAVTAELCDPGGGPKIEERRVSTASTRSLG
jgi:hypothetical protein